MIQKRQITNGMRRMTTSPKMLYLTNKERQVTMSIYQRINCKTLTTATRQTLVKH